MQNKFYTNYRVFENDAMATKDSFLQHCIGFKDLFISSNNTIMIFEIGLPSILMLVFSIMTLRRIEENKKEYIFLLIIGIITAFMTTKYFPWKYLPDGCFIIQFPWRLLVISTFCFSVVCGINMMTVVKNFNIKDVVIISVICVIYIISKWSVIQYNENVVEVEKNQTSSVTGQNNEWLPGMGRLEYLPSNAYENTFYIATREDGIVKLEGECDIHDYVKIGCYMSSKIVTNEEMVVLELPYIYYPGYTLRFDGVIQQIFETENGFIGCKIDKNETGKLELTYTGTKIMNFSKGVSMLAIIVFGVYVWKKH